MNDIQHNNTAIVLNVAMLSRVLFIVMLNAIMMNVLTPSLRIQITPKMSYS